MGRVLSANMNTILAASGRKIDYTLDLTFPDATSFKFATAPLVIPVKGTFTNDVETVSEIRQTLESPNDRVSQGLQNKDRVLGLDIAANWQLWRKAEAVIGRLYRDVDGLGLSEWIEMFRGSVQQPNANDLQVTFEVIHDTLTPGEIVANRNLAPQCPSVYKDPKTCASTSLLPTCNHDLKSSGGCDGRANSHRYAGMAHRYNPDLSVPGTGGNTGGGGGIIGYCPRLDQFVRVRGKDGLPVPKMVCFVTEEDWLWHPIQRTFHRIKSLRIIRNVAIWELVTQFGAVGYSSASHPIIRDAADVKGLPIGKMQKQMNVLGLDGVDLVKTKCLIAQNTGEFGDVMNIEMEDGKIYCWGDAEDKMIACHNSKPLEDF